MRRLLIIIIYEPFSFATLRLENINIGISMGKGITIGIGTR